MRHATDLPARHAARLARIAGAHTTDAPAPAPTAPRSLGNQDTLASAGGLFVLPFGILAVIATTILAAAGVRYAFAGALWLLDAVASTPGMF